MAVLRRPSSVAPREPVPLVPDRFRSYEEFLEFMFRRKASGVKLGLENTRRALERLEHPEASLTAIHVAGTNGKGSTSAMVESILSAAGYRTGLYTSPHLLDYRERIRVDGRAASREELLEAAERILPHLPEVPLTFFEITTILAFLVFEARRVDVAVMEVGLGGRLDATNVLEKAFPVITDIHFDHERVLGRRLAEIASEKAGIIRGDRPVVTGVRRRAVVDLIEARCREHGAALTVLKDRVRWRIRDLSWRGTTFRLETGKNVYPDLVLPLPGEHQVANAALSVVAVETMGRTLGLRVDPGAVRDGLARVRWPGRLQVIGENPLVALDAAHNPGGARALSRALGKLFPDRKKVLVLGMLVDKNFRRVIGLLAPGVGELVVTAPANDRGAPAELLARAAWAQGYRASTVPEVASAVERGVQAAGPEGVVCVAGSCYTVGEALGALGVTDPFDA